MTQKTTASDLMRRMGFPDTKVYGPYMQKLHKKLERDIAGGLISRSGGTWGPGAKELTLEERAKAILAFDWAIDNGHCFRVKNIDGHLISKKFDVKTGKQTVSIKWKRIPDWFEDRWNESMMKLRIFHHKITKKKNPYL